MYNCPDCGGLMRFDIEHQRLQCDYCGAYRTVEEHPQQMKDAGLAVYDTTVFTCRTMCTM